MTHQARNCRACGAPLADSAPSYHHSCRTCYDAGRQRSRPDPTATPWADPRPASGPAWGASPPRPDPRLAAAERRAEAAEAEVARLRRALLMLESPKPASGGVMLDRDEVRALLRRCHPDQWSAPEAEGIARKLISAR